MSKVLIVVDMQNDFIDGALGTKEAEAIVRRVIAKIRKHSGTVVYTRDTHQEGYLATQEGHNLPVVHCIEGTLSSLRRIITVWYIIRIPLVPASW